jgi:hypothetical protein
LQNDLNRNKSDSPARDGIAQRKNIQQKRSDRKLIKVLTDFLLNRRGEQFKSLDVSNPDVIIKKLKIDQSVGKTNYFKGGTREAKRLQRTDCRL